MCTREGGRVSARERGASAGEKIEKARTSLQMTNLIYYILHKIIENGK